MGISLTTAFTIIGSFGAASTAQIVGHILTKKREEKKFKKECLQNLYSPTLFKVLDYLHLEGGKHCPSPFYSKNIDTTPIFDKVMDNIGENLKYAEVDLINIYQELKYNYVTNTFTDNDDDYFTTERIRLCNILITQYLHIAKELKTESKLLSEKIAGPYFFSHFYLLVKDIVHLMDIPSKDILSLYDLVETILLPQNNFIEGITEIRKRLFGLNYTSLSKFNNLSEVTHIEAYQFLYEMVDEFSIISESRAEEWKMSLDDNLVNIHN